MELVRRQVGSVLVLSFAEPLTLEGGTSQRFKEKVRGDITEGSRNIVVDLGKVEFIDSSGLGALISALKVLRANNGDLKLANIPDQVHSVLKITRLLRVFDHFSTAEDAVRSLDGAGSIPS
jgi:anti-sigma B factor antagonist